MGTKHCICRNDLVERKSDDSGDNDNLWSNVQQVRECGNPVTRPEGAAVTGGQMVGTWGGGCMSSPLWLLFSW